MRPTLIVSALLLAISQAPGRTLKRRPEQVHKDSEGIRLQSIGPRIEGVAVPGTRLPLLVWRGVLPRNKGSASIVAFLAERRWTPNLQSSRSVHLTPHYHAIHEAVLILDGKVEMLYDHDAISVLLQAGDVVFHPAGLWHQRVNHSKDIHVLGAFPNRTGKWQILTQPPARRLLGIIARRADPATDPVFKGRQLWQYYREALALPPR